MLIDNVNVKSFGAILMEKNIQPSSIDSEGKYLWLENSLHPIFLEQKLKFSLVEVKLYIKGLSESDVKSKIGALINKSKECTLNFEDDLNYKSFIINQSTENTLKKETKILNINFVAYAYKTEVIETMNRVLTKTINASGNTESPAIVEITPSIALIDLTIGGLDEDPIIIKNLEANKKIILDGEKSKITVNGANKFGDTNMWNFPRLIPGSNVITVDKNSCDITIKYKPRFL